MSSIFDRWKSPAWLFQTKEDAILDLMGTSLSVGQSIAVEDAETATVTDVLTVKHTSSGTPAAGFGAGISLQGEDGSGNGAEEWASIDAVAVTVTAGAEDADLVISVKDDGTVKEVLRVVGDTPRAKITTADAATNAVSDMLILSHSTSGTAAASLGNGVSFEIEDASGNTPQEAASIDVIWTTATHGSEEGDMIFNVAQTNGTVNELMRLDGSADNLVVAGGITATGTITGSGIVEGTTLKGSHRHTSQELTVSGAITITSGLVLLNHATVIVAATKAAPAVGDELYIVDSSATGTANHTVTCAAGGTWDGTNNTATFNLLGDALHVIAITTTRWLILVNLGSVALSSV